MIDHLVRDLQVLRKADFLIAKIWFGVLLRRSGSVAFAGLIAVFGLGMANVAGFYALQGPLGSVWAAAIVAVVDFVIAAIVLLVASNSRPGPEIDLAFDVRKMAVESIQTDARDLKQTIDALGQEIRDVKANIVGFAHNPLDVAAQKLLVPAALSLIKGMRSKKACSLRVFLWSQPTNAAFAKPRTTKNARDYQRREPYMTREGKFIPASLILQELHDQAPAGPVTLQWVMERLRQQSFGMIILILAIAAAAPGVSVLAGLLLLVPSFQMMIGLSELKFPRWIATRELPTRHVGAVMRGAIPILKYLERAIYPRFATPSGTTRSVVGVVIFVLTIRLLLAPLPLSNILPAILIADLSRTGRLTPYHGAAGWMPFSHRRNRRNLAADPQCEKQLACELSETRRSHSIFNSRRTFVAAATNQANCRARCNARAWMGRWRQLVMKNRSITRIDWWPRAELASCLNQ